MIQNRLVNRNIEMYIDTTLMTIIIVLFVVLLENVRYFIILKPILLKALNFFLYFIMH